MERVTRLGGLFLRAEDPMRLGRWYADHLGVETAPEPADPAPGLSVFTAMPAGATSATFEVSDLDAMVFQLRNAGIDVDVDPAGYPDGRFASLRDPEGNLVRLWQPAGAWSGAPGYVQPIAETTDSDVPPPRRRTARWLPLAIGALVLTVSVVVASRDSEPAETAAAKPTTTRTSTTTSRPPTTTPVVTTVGRRMLGVTAGWEIFAFGSGELVRIEPARGRVTRTPVPIRAAIQPTFLLVGSDRVLIQPHEPVAGFVVPDGQAAGPMPGRLRELGRPFPGPEPDLIWLQSFDAGGLSLVTMDGEPTGRTISSAGDIWPDLPDGRGNLLGSGIGGVYLMSPSGIDRITTGVLIAAGRTRFLVLECDERARCGAVVVDRLTGARRALDVGVVTRHYDPGVISPDGSYAAVMTSAYEPQIRIINLDTGAEHTADIDLGTEPNYIYNTTTMAWSPDSRWLFAPSVRKLVAVEAATGRTRELEVDVFGVDAVAVRAG